MKSHNRPVYHCVSCGHVVAEEPGQVAPFCCGHEMIKAAEEMVRTAEDVAVPSDNVRCSARLDQPWIVKDRESIPV